jgi:ABC-2 type transport system permease protein
MTRALSSEWLKLRTTKTGGAFALTSVFLALLVAILIATTDDPATLGRSLDTFPGFTKLAGFVGLLTFAAGIRAFTDEYRFSTITGTVLGTPRRSIVLAAKAMSSRSRSRRSCSGVASGCSRTSTSR